MNQTIAFCHKIASMEKEIAFLRSFVIGISGRDEEGNYNSAFAKKVLASSRKKPTGKIASVKDFLRKFSK